MAVPGGRRAHPLYLNADPDDGDGDAGSRSGGAARVAGLWKWAVPPTWKSPCRPLLPSPSCANPQRRPNSQAKPPENTIAWVRHVLDRNILCPHEACKLRPGVTPVNRIDMKIA